MTKTKEDILQFHIDNDGRVQIVFGRMRSVALSAMDEYAQQEAIEFLIWMIENYNEPYEGFSLNTFTDGSEPTKFDNGEEKPLSHFYNKFIQSKQK